MGPLPLYTDGEVVGDTVGNARRAVDVTETDGYNPNGSCERNETGGVFWPVTDGGIDRLFELDM